MGNGVKTHLLNLDNYISFLICNEIDTFINKLVGS